MAIIFPSFFFFVSEAFSLDVPSQSVFELGVTGATVTCTLFFNLELSSLQIVWFFVNVTNSTHFEGGSGKGSLLMSNSSQSVDLTLDSMDVSNAGIYSCEAILADSVGKIANISRNHTLFVQSKLK